MELEDKVVKVCDSDCRASTITKAKKKDEKRSEQIRKYAGRMAFSKFVENCRTKMGSQAIWRCCETEFLTMKEIHMHVSQLHKVAIKQTEHELFTEGAPDAKWKALKKKSLDNCNQRAVSTYPVEFTPEDQYDWLPVVDTSQITGTEGQVLLFYKYCDINKHAEHVLQWQKEICRRLLLTGKIRIATEGINATIAGSKSATEVYLKSMKQHPLFIGLSDEDFKSSEGNQSVFPAGLKIGVYKEIVPMGVDPAAVPYTDAATHLEPEEFHRAVDGMLGSQEERDSVLIDCRNYYESKIGQFRGAIAPDLRKFSYWPEYIDANLDAIKDKKVYMYCTGGIRCERGSAYLRAKGVDNVYQLKGGIHKYLEKYPDGHFRGKLFVFDDRYTIHTNEDILSKCYYCDTPWDKYHPCSSEHCHQLVLSCASCRRDNKTACCVKCQENGDNRVLKEECDCTRSRPRIPIETV